MPDLYVANCSQQNQIVYFRRNFSAKGSPVQTFTPPTQREIAPGHQVKILAGEPMDTVDSVTEQLRPYGLIGVTDIPRAKDVVPYIFNVDRPVTKTQIMQVMDHNTRVKIMDGKVRRQKAAVASNDLVTNTVANELARQGLPPESMPDTAGTTVEFEQLEQSEAGEKRIEEGIHVRADAPNQRPGKVNKSGNRRGLR